MTADAMSTDMSAEVPVLKKQVLIVEDETVFAKAVQKQLARSGFEGKLAGDLATARSEYDRGVPDLVLLDMRLPDGSGLDFLSYVRKEKNSPVPVLVMSAYGEIGDVVSAMKLGASDYLKKPVDLDELMMNVEKVMERQAISQKLQYSSLREHSATEEVEFLGRCPQINEIRKQVDRISKLTQSASSIPPIVLILGETGTGKDVVARMLHARSSRADQPFVHVDCANLPKDLIEAELFGHEKGAFTDAHSSRVGLIEAAENGVVFMDEIGELNLDLQSKLLAVLERRMVRRVGTSQEIPIAAWFIAATNRDIEKLAESGEFRSDLYYRLNVLTITMPPLRERGDDIVLLADYFSKLTARRYGLPQPELTKEVRKVLKEYHWPGNVRELKHMIERAVLLCEDGKVSPENLSLSAVSEKKAMGSSPDENLTLEEAELKLIQDALTRTNGNVSRAARELGITRMALRYRMKKYNL